MGALRASRRRPYCFTASNTDGAGSADVAALSGVLRPGPGSISGAKDRLNSYWPSMLVISTTGRAVKRDISPTRLARLADGAIMVTPLVENVNIIMSLGLPSGPRALGELL